MLTQDFILNGAGAGPLGSVIQPRGGRRFDPGLWRPYFDHRTGQACVTINSGRTKYNEKTLQDEPIYEQVAIRDLQQGGMFLPVHNATSLEKLQWVELDRVIIAAARQRLRAWSDLAGASPYSLNGMRKTILEHQMTNDPGEALVDMDGLSEVRSDARTFALQGIPLPITHSGFRYNARELEISRSSGIPLNVRDAEAAARRVAEKVEQTLIGNVTGLTFGDATDYATGTSKVYGYTNYPNRATATLTTPTGSNPEATVADVLEMREELYNNGYYGPYMLYHSKNWDVHLDNDYARLGGSNANMTLRDRIRRIEGIQDVRRLDFFTSGYQMILVQMTSDVAQAVIGMGVTTIQWETMGGMQQHFKVMAIHVPRLFSDINGNCGICHGTA